MNDNIRTTLGRVPERGAGSKGSAAGRTRAFNIALWRRASGAGGRMRDLQSRSMRADYGDSDYKVT